ncbi:phenylalanine--tRNA ligase subunit beta, partial [Candidatus Peregrinibacteria bacterium]|nr:phenylalanine--tRNA ligase subunit beta [Candidatus Peregrinibacteria bacterium]
KHPNADKLKIAKTSVGKDTHQIVCGGENLKEGMYVAVALPGSSVKWHGEGDPVVLEKAKIRGEESYGMICAGSEIGVDDKESGPRDIMDLSSIKPEPGTPLSEIFKKDDVILEFDNKSLTHRPDLWGHYGIAREIAAIKGTKFKKCEPKVKIPAKGESVDVKIEDFDLCPRYCGLIINNIKVEESPEWMKKRLKATGHGTHSNIVDVTNYILTELGQPMHAFDKDFIKGGIVVRRAKKGEKITSLDNKERALTEENLVIADHEKSVAVAGVIGGENSEINKGTTSIILESANFNAGSVRRTSVQLGVRTDAVQRFEKSLDPHLAELAIKRAAELILEICPGAEIAGPITDTKKFNEKPLKINLDLEKTASKIGVELKPKQIKEILESLEFQIKEKDKNTFEVTVPTHRSSKDVTIEDDLIEEVARMYGYDNIAPTLPHLPTRLPEENTERFKKHRARELFSFGLGFDEVYNYSFYGEKELSDCLMSDQCHMKLLNYLSEDQTHMRVTLIPNLLKNLRENIKYADEFSLYEIGRTFKDFGEYFPLEEKNLGGAIVKKGKKAQTFYEAKGAVEAFLKKFGLKASVAKGVEHTPYAHPNKAISFIGQNGKTIAQVFEVHPTVAKNHDLEKYSASMFEINFTEALKLEKDDKSFTQIPKFPAIVIDVSVLIDKTTEIKAIQKAILEADKHLITETELFDIYEGEGIEEDKKAVAFKITLQAEDRTLTDDEMTQVQSKIFKNLEAIGGQIRGK